MAVRPPEGSSVDRRWPRWRIDWLRRCHLQSKVQPATPAPTIQPGGPINPQGGAVRSFVRCTCRVAPGVGREAVWSNASSRDPESWPEPDDSVTVERCQVASESDR